MSSHEDLDAILKRLEDGTQTEADVAALRQLLRGEGRSEVVQQLAKYNIHMDKAEGIQIGDRYYNTPKPENAEVDFRRYLRSLTEEYRHWWEKYTLTDALGREKRKEKGRSPSEWNFDLMVQTARRQEPEEHQEEKEKIERFPVLEGLRKYAKDHVLLVGRPGSGKSTALVMLLLEEAALTPLPPSPNSERGGSRLESEVRSQVPQTSEVFKTSEVLAPASLPSRIPVLVELRFWQTSILDRILKVLQKHDPELNLSEQTVEALLKQGRLLLLVDGLNELPSEEARRDVARFRNDYRTTTPMIFTTRELSVGGDLGIEKKLEMQPLAEGQMRSFVKAYLPERGDALLAQLKDRLRELGQTPLLLAMLCSIFQNTEQLPNNLGEVFRQFTQFYENGLKQDVPVSDESRHWWRPLLERLAFVMMHEDLRLTSSVEFRVAISQREALETFREFLQGEVNDPGDRAIECLEDLLEHHLIQLNGDRIEFRHQMIQEYYAAEYFLLLLPKLTDVQLQHHYLNYLKWTEALSLAMSLIDAEFDFKRIARESLEVDLILGVLLSSRSISKFDEAMVTLIINLNVPTKLKIKLLGMSSREAAVSHLIDFMNTPEHLSEAISALRNIGSRNSMPIFIEILDKTHDKFDRANILYALAENGGEQAISAIAKSLKSQNFESKIDALTAIKLFTGKHGSSVSLDILEGFLCELIDKDDEEEYLIESVAEIIGKLKSENLSDLIDLLGHWNLSVRRGVAKSLRALEDSRVIPFLMETLRNSLNTSPQNHVIQFGIIEAIKELISVDNSFVFLPAYIKPKVEIRDASFAIQSFSGNSSLQVLMYILQNSKNEYLREKIIIVLGLLGAEKAVPLILENLMHNSNDYLEDYSIRLEAANSLGKIGSECSVSGLIDALEDTSREVRLKAIHALGEIGSEVAIPALMTIYNCESNYVCAEIIRSLGKIGSEQAVAELISILEKGAVSLLRCDAVTALKKLRSKMVIPTLINILDDKSDLEVCAYSADALGELGDTEAVSSLLGALTVDDSNVHISAAKALAKLGHSEGIIQLLESLNYQDKDIRLKVIRILGELKINQAIPKLLELIRSDEDKLILACTVNSLIEIDVEGSILELLKVLENPNFDAHWSTSKALGEVSKPYILADLWRMLLNKPESWWYMEEAIAAIQSRCKFYNYELYQQAQSQAEESDRPQTTQPIVQMIFNERVYGVAGNVEGDFNNQGLPSAKLDDNKK